MQYILPQKVVKNSQRNIRSMITNLDSMANVVCLVAYYSSFFLCREFIGTLISYEIQTTYDFQYRIKFAQ